MSYCLAVQVAQGIVFLADTRASAAVDDVHQVRKMSVFECPGERLLVLLGVGSLAQTQAVLDLLRHPAEHGLASLDHAVTLQAAARIVSDAVRRVHRHEAQALQDFALDFDCSFILGGQIGAPSAQASAEWGPQLFQIYPSGSIVGVSSTMPCLQIGETNLGRSLLSWGLCGAPLSLDEATLCALLAMDGTLRTSLSVGLPVDLLVYERDSLRVTRFVSLDQHAAYFHALREGWCRQVRHALGTLPRPPWEIPASVPRR